MSLSDKVTAEQAAVKAGQPACGSPHPAGDVESDCVRLMHLPGDTVHVGLLSDGAGGTMFIQWEG